jgi:cytochrome c553
MGKDMRNLLKVAIPLSIALAATLAFAKKPVTPFGKWMNANVGSNMGGDPDSFAALQKNLVLVAGKLPPTGSYPKWAEMANAGAAAAGKQDLKGAKASCKSCHDAYQAQYIKENPTAQFP